MRNLILADLTNDQHLTAGLCQSFSYSGPYVSASGDGCVDMQGNWSASGSAQLNGTSFGGSASGSGTLGEGGSIDWSTNGGHSGTISW